MTGQPVVLTRVAVSYGGTTALPPTSLRVTPGECVAVVGPSGSGKSTLLGCLAGTVVPTQGRVEVGDVVVSDLDARRRASLRRARFGLMFQDAQLLPELDVEENVALLPVFDGRPRADALAAARHALSDVGLPGLEHRRIDQLSGGQLQRVALARALVRPEVAVLVADEPTASLDRASAAEMAAILVARVHDTGVTAVVATHDPLVADAADRVVDLSGFAVGAGGTT